VTIISYGAMFGPVLRDMRVNAGMTQQQLGEASGVPSSMISTYERSRNIPELDTVIRLLGALGQRLTALPASVAKTQAERENVIVMAKAWRRGERDKSSDALTQALSSLADAENNLPDIDDSPHETIRDLNETIAAKDREIRMLRKVLADTHAATLKALTNEF